MNCHIRFAEIIMIEISYGGLMVYRMLLDAPLVVRNES